MCLAEGLLHRCPRPPPPRPIDRLLSPITTFAAHKLAGAALLMLATVAALIWANSPWAHYYHDLLDLKLGVAAGGHGINKTVHHWINDGLMGIFFFLVGLEIKRELLAGELSTFRKAALPAIAALGGMVLPALVFVVVNTDGPTAHGWGIPMATDIAFALGVLALLGDRVPVGLKVFLTALAIVDDIGAVVVIAVAYTSELSLIALGVGASCLVVSIVLNLIGARNAVSYFIVGSIAWVGFLESGVHATIAAMLMAFTIPARTRLGGDNLIAHMTSLGRQLSANLPTNTTMNTAPQQHLLEEMHKTVDLASAPLQRIEHALVGPVTFFVLPIFALANAGMTLGGDLSSSLRSPMVLGIVLGLALGKALGISGFAWLAVRLGIADLPRGVTWGQVVGVGALGGIGFTMALFVAQLAFLDPVHVEAAKLAILVASTLSGVVGFFVVRATIPPSEAPAA